MGTFVQHQDLHHKDQNWIDSPCLTKKGIKDLKLKKSFKAFNKKEQSMQNKTNMCTRATRLQKE